MTEQTGLDRANDSIQKMYENDLKELDRKLKSYRNKIEQLSKENIELTKDRLQLEGQAQLKLAKVKSNEYEINELVNAIDRFLDEVTQVKENLKENN